MTAQNDGYKAKSFEPKNLLLYFLIVFGLDAIMWVFLGLLGLKKPVNLIFAIPAAGGPTIAAFVLTAIFEGKSGVKALWGRLWNRNLPLKWLLVSLFLYEGMRLLTNLIVRILDSKPYPIIDTSNPLWMVVPLFLGAFISSGIGEEFGWRGYVLPRFQAKWNALISSIILGIVWAAWHIPTFFLSDFPLYQQNFWAWAPLIILSSIIYTWIFNNSKGSVLGASIIHAALNTSIVVIPQTVLSTWVFYGIMLVFIILIVIIFGPKSFVRERSAGTMERTSL